MTVYTPNIPQPGDNPSDSQDLILENFQTLESLYGTSGDHYSWTNTNPPESAKHAKVTLPGLPTATAPGNVLPTPSSGNCAIFAQTRDGQTTPFVARDGLVPITPVTNAWPLLPIKSYASFSITGAAAGSILDSFNISGGVVSTVAGINTITFSMINAMRTATSYGIQVSISATNLTDFSYTAIDSTHFSISIRNLLSFFPYRITVMAIES